MISLPIGSAAHVEWPLRITSRHGFAYSGPSLTRMSSACTPSTSATAAAGPIPCRTSAFDHRLCRPRPGCQPEGG
jgi:hypothetical protein